MPRFKTLADWSEVYDKIIDSKPVCAKTKANRRNAMAHVLRGLGARTISSIRPHEVAALVNSHAVGHPQTAKRVLFEARDIFGEAMNYGWIDRNPAISVKAPLVRIQRKRLSLDQWQAIHKFAASDMPPWVARMLVLAVITGQRRSDLVKMRFADVWDDHLHVEQAKTGTRLALPLALRLDVIGMTLGEAIEDCRAYAVGSEFMLRKHDGHQLGDASLSARFEVAREAVIPFAKGTPASLHECRSLSERLYRAQGIDTMVLLGHKHQAMTDVYNDDRGLTKGQWKTLSL